MLLIPKIRIKVTGAGISTMPHHSVQVIQPCCLQNEILFFLIFRFISFAHTSSDCNLQFEYAEALDIDGPLRVRFFASRDIAIGEELCFDYGDEYCWE